MQFGGKEIAELGLCKSRGRSGLGSALWATGPLTLRKGSFRPAAIADTSRTKRFQECFERVANALQAAVPVRLTGPAIRNESGAVGVLVRASTVRALSSLARWRCCLHVRANVIG